MKRARDQDELPHSHTRAARSDGQRFRERLGFVFLGMIGFYFLVQILVEFKPVLEPFLWAVVFVSAIDPVVSMVESRILALLACFGSCLHGGLGLVHENHLRRGFQFIQGLLPCVPFAAWQRLTKGSFPTRQDLDDDECAPATPGFSAWASTNSRPWRQSSAHHRHSRPQPERSAGGGFQDISMENICDEGGSSHTRRLDSTPQRPRGRFEPTSWRRAFAKYASIVIVLGFILSLITMFFFFVVQSARQMRDHWSVYEQGADNLRRAVADLQRSLVRNLAEKFAEGPLDGGRGAESLRSTNSSGSTSSQQGQAEPPGAASRATFSTPLSRLLFSDFAHMLAAVNGDGMAQELLSTVQDLVYSMLGSLLNNVGSLMFSSAMTTLYALFWLMGRRAAAGDEEYEEQQLDSRLGRSSSRSSRKDHHELVEPGSRRDTFAPRAEGYFGGPHDEELANEERTSLLHGSYHIGSGSDGDGLTHEPPEVGNHTASSSGAEAGRVGAQAKQPMDAGTRAPAPKSDTHIVGQLRGTFRRYLLLKTISCLGFGSAVGIWLSTLQVDLAAVFGAITFLLNYVPEVGPFISMILPTPIILLDSRLERPFFTLLLAIVGQIALKFAFANIVEVKLIESDEQLKMHPVVILLSVAMWGHVWGPTGMLLSVPLMAFLKISLLSEVVPASYRDPLLIVLEGDTEAPRRLRFEGAGVSK